MANEELIERGMAVLDYCDEIDRPRLEYALEQLLEPRIDAIDGGSNAGLMKEVAETIVRRAEKFA